MDFRLMGLGDRITVRHRDVCGPEGFSPVAAGSVDAVFLDLPQARLVGGLRASGHTLHALRSWLRCSLGTRSLTRKPPCAPAGLSAPSPRA